MSNELNELFKLVDEGHEITIKPGENYYHNEWVDTKQKYKYLIIAKFGGDEVSRTEGDFPPDIIADLWASTPESDDVKKLAKWQEATRAA